MTWFNWHEPVITGAQAAWAIGAVIALNVLVSIGSALTRRAEPINLEQEEEPVGDFPYSSHVMKDGL